MRAFFISDLHLKNSEEPSSKTLLGFLIQIEKTLGSVDPATHLFLVGDIFDLWIASHKFFIEKFHPIINQIKRLRELGLEIHYFEGNHDLYLEDFWKNKLGIRVHSKAAIFQLGRLKVRVEHGDLINPNDKGYLFLYKLLRTQPLPWLARHLPSGLVKAIGVKASGASRTYTSTAKSIRDEAVKDLIHAHALRELQFEKFDMIVSGHVHVKDDHVLENGIRSINLGAWFDYPKCLIISDSQVDFYRLSEEGAWSKT